MMMRMRLGIVLDFVFLLWQVVNGLFFSIEGKGFGWKGYQKTVGVKGEFG